MMVSKTQETSKVSAFLNCIKSSVPATRLQCMYRRHYNVEKQKLTACVRKHSVREEEQAKREMRIEINRKDREHETRTKPRKK